MQFNFTRVLDDKNQAEVFDVSSRSRSLRLRTNPMPRPPYAVVSLIKTQVCGKSMVQLVLDGYNCTIMAYGQTGSGKTYTMTGETGRAPGVWGQDLPKSLRATVRLATCLIEAPPPREAVPPEQECYAVYGCQHLLDRPCLAFLCF